MLECTLNTFHQLPGSSCLKSAGQQTCKNQLFRSAFSCCQKALFSFPNVFCMSLFFFCFRFKPFAFDALAYTGKALAQALSVCLCTAHQDLLPLCCPDCFQAVCGCVCVCVCTGRQVRLPLDCSDCLQALSLSFLSLCVCTNCCLSSRDAHEAMLALDVARYCSQFVPCKNVVPVSFEADFCAVRELRNKFRAMIVAFYMGWDKRSDSALIHRACCLTSLLGT